MDKYLLTEEEINNIKVTSSDIEHLVYQDNETDKEFETRVIQAIDIIGKTKVAKAQLAKLAKLKSPDDVREKVARFIAAVRGLVVWDTLPDEQSKVCGCACKEACYRYSDTIHAIYAPLLQAAEQKGRQEERERIQGKWLDKPDKGGWWWKAVFMDEMCCGVQPMRVIDYDRPGRGLEVDEGHGDTIPVDKYKINYYPNSMWLYIPEPEYPEWQSLGDA